MRSEARRWTMISSDSNSRRNAAKHAALSDKQSPCSSRSAKETMFILEGGKLKVNHIRLGS